VLREAAAARSAGVCCASSVSSSRSEKFMGQAYHPLAAAS
jgi:hypothetical protein